MCVIRAGLFAVNQPPDDCSGNHANGDPDRHGTDAPEFVHKAAQIGPELVKVKSFFLQTAFAALLLYGWNKHGRREQKTGNSNSWNCRCCEK
jgi:hypothetical protein